MKGINHLIFLLLCSTSLFSTNYNYNGGSVPHWSSQENWDVYPGTTLLEGDTVFINSECLVPTELLEIFGVVVINNGASFSVCSEASVYGEIKNNGSLFTDGMVYITESGKIVNDNLMTGFGYLLEGELINNGLAEAISFTDFFGSIINNGTFYIDDIPSGAEGSLHNTSTGFLFGGSIFVGGDLINDGTVENAWLEVYGSVINNSSMDNVTIYAWSGAVIQNNDYINAEWFELNEDSQLTNTGTLEVYEFLSVWETASFVNSGTTNAFNFQNLGILNNSGTMTLTGQGNNGFDEDFGIETGYIVNDGLIHNLGVFYNNDTIYNNLDLLNDGDFLGDGVIIGNVIIEGNMAPGNSPGVFTVVGDYEQTETANLIIEIDGSATGVAGVDYDQVNITGNATLAGTLTVVLNTTEPNVGDVFPIFIYGSLEPGSVLILDAPLLSGDKTWFLQYNDDGILLIVDSALPVRLSAFKISDTPNGVQLNWTTESEVSNKGFEILRSKNTSSWETIGFVEGNGTSLDKKEYLFLDKNPLTAVSYYKLKQVDDNGKFEFSDVLSIERESRLSVFPNPTSDYISIRVLEKTRFKILTQTGLLIKEGFVEETKPIDVRTLASGNYMIKLETETIQFRKQ